MLKSIFNLLKRIVFSAFLLYGFNLIVAPLNIIIPINLVTVLLLSILGIPILFGLLFILVVIY